MSLLAICEILALFDNTLTTDNKYFLCNGKNLPQTIQMQLSKNQETFPQFLAPLLTSTSNFKHLDLKDDPQRLYILEIR